MTLRLTLILFLLTGLWPLAQAHEGHAGPPVTTLETRAALKALLPEGAKLAKRKQRLTDKAAEAVAKRYGRAPQHGLVTYYLARDRASGKILALAIIDRTKYRHGKIKLAVGLDDQQRLTGAAILAVNEKYLPDVKSSLGTGLLTEFQGMSLQALIKRTNDAKDEARRTILEGLTRAALRLAALQETR